MSTSIKIEKLTKYHGDNLIIDDLSLAIAPGEIVIFQGPSGIGKSTFLRCLTYLEPFQKGVVRVGDLQIEANIDIQEERARIRALRQRVGFVFQFFNLFPHLTVLENIMFGPLKVLKQSLARTKEEAFDLLTKVGLEQKANIYPSALSGGQAQRVCIARTLAMHPQVILFDEPTSSLDPEMKEEIVQVIEKFEKGLTMLIVTHEPAVIKRIATRIVRFGQHCRIESDQSCF